MNYIGVWTFVGFFFGLFAVAVAFLAAGGGHGTYMPAAALFPYTMILTMFTREILGVFGLLAFIQFALYGYVIDRGRANGYVWRAVLAVVAGHLTAVFIALSLGAGFF